MPLHKIILFVEVLWFPEYKDNFSFINIRANHKKCPTMQWQGQLLQRPEKYFPWEVSGEDDCNDPSQERRNTSNSRRFSRIEDSLLMRSRLSSRPSTSLPQQLQQCIYIMYLIQIQIFCLQFGLASSSRSSHRKFMISQYK